MLEVEPLWQLAARMGRPTFVTRHMGWYLLKHPGPISVVPEGPLGWNTISVSIDEEDGGDPFPGEWRLLEVKKRPGNPFPDRIGVGRAQNCDVVLRLPFVSKLHAHFLDGVGAGLRICDLRSANGTSLNGRPLDPGEAADTTSGDWIGFGPLRLQLLDASDLFDTLQRRP
ncbi:MAG TPA: FHA domain-containing protein [Nannocystaceae bacterium]|nr:FHA domain-containing protein [Nannocystaceae bacterium]